MKKVFKYIYGPVASWRLGRSLGIDLLSQKEKLCNFDCSYCQLGRTRTYIGKRKVWVSTRKILEELKKFPKVRIDTITFSGRGESTLARNLGQTIKEVKKLRNEPVTVITNSSLMHRKDVRKELCLADCVVVKCDAFSRRSFAKINRPMADLDLKRTMNGIKKFRSEYRGKLALQMMFLKDNKEHLGRFINFVKLVQPDEVQINTPLRPCAVKPLSKDEILNIKKIFFNHCISLVVHEKTKIISVFDQVKKKKIFAVRGADALKRRGKT